MDDWGPCQRKEGAQDELRGLEASLADAGRGSSRYSHIFTRRFSPNPVPAEGIGPHGARVRRVAFATTRGSSEFHTVLSGPNAYHAVQCCIRFPKTRHRAPTTILLTTMILLSSTRSASEKEDGWIMDNEIASLVSGVWTTIQYIHSLCSSSSSRDAAYSTTRRRRGVETKSKIFRSRLTPAHFTPR